MNSERLTVFLLVGILVLNLAWNSIRKQVDTEAENILEIIENE